jgi:hypothetical protein
MRIYVLKALGILFLIGGLWILILALFRETKAISFLSVKLAGIDLGNILYGILTLVAGYNILRSNASGRISGIIVLCPYLILLSVVSMSVYILSGEATQMPYIKFLGTQFGMTKDYSITDPLLAALIEFLFALMVGLVIWLLFSKRTKELFVGNKTAETQ